MTGKNVSDENTSFQTARVSPNGRYLAFMSNRSLTGYDNEDVSSEHPGERLDEEVFLFDSADGHADVRLLRPSGARPTGVLDQEHSGEGIGLLVDRRESWRGQWIAGQHPRRGPQRAWSNSLIQSRYLSNEGRAVLRQRRPARRRRRRAQRAKSSSTARPSRSGSRTSTSTSPPARRLREHLGRLRRAALRRQLEPRIRLPGSHPDRQRSVLDHRAHGCPRTTPTARSTSTTRTNAPPPRPACRRRNPPRRRATARPNATPRRPPDSSPRSRREARASPGPATSNRSRSLPRRVTVEGRTQKQETADARAKAEQSARPVPQAYAPLAQQTKACEAHARKLYGATVPHSDRQPANREARDEPRRATVAPLVFGLAISCLATAATAQAQTPWWWADDRSHPHQPAAAGHEGQHRRRGHQSRRRSRQRHTNTAVTISDRLPQGSTATAISGQTKAGTNNDLRARDAPMHLPGHACSPTNGSRSRSRSRSKSRRHRHDARQRSHRRRRRRGRSRRSATQPLTINGAATPFGVADGRLPTGAVQRSRSTGNDTPARTRSS